MACRIRFALSGIRSFSRSLLHRRLPIKKERSYPFVRRAAFLPALSLNAVPVLDKDDYRRAFLYVWSARFMSLRATWIRVLTVPIGISRWSGIEMYLYPS